MAQLIWLVFFKKIFVILPIKFFKQKKKMEKIDQKIKTYLGKLESAYSNGTFA